MHDVGMGHAACSNLRIYMDHALRVPAISLVSWNETRDFLFMCSPSSGRGPRYECMCDVQVWVMDMEYCIGVTRHQLDLVLYGLGYIYPFLFSRAGNLGLGMRESCIMINVILWVSVIISNSSSGTQGDFLMFFDRGPCMVWV